MRVAPGGPFNQEKGLNPDIKANLERVYHLDEPLWQQYLHYLEQPAARRFRPELQPARLHRRRTLSPQGLPISIQLGASALILALLVGGVLGIVAALHQNSGADYAVIATATAGSTIPTFVIAPLYPAALRARPELAAGRRLGRRRASSTRSARCSPWRCRRSPSSRA